MQYNAITASALLYILLVPPRALPPGCVDTMSNQQSPPPADVSRPSKGGIQVIARAAEILRVLMERPRGLSLGEIALDVGLPRSTVQRIVDALAKENLVLPATASHGVKLGPALISLGAATHFPIAEWAAPCLATLAKHCGETVDLSIVSRTNMVFLEQIPGTHRLAALSAVGVTFPFHSTANGKAALALMDENSLGKMRQRLTLERYTANTITHWDALLDELSRIRERGVAFDREENTLGICAVAKALRSPSNELVAISIPVPSVRFRDKEAYLSDLLAMELATLQSKYR